MMDPTLLGLAFLSAWHLLLTGAAGVVPGLAGWLIGRYKGFPLRGFLAGFVLGLLGLVVIAVIPSTRAAKAARVLRAHRQLAAANGGAAGPAGTNSAMPAPGWYPDPYGEPGMRWWDGSNWASQTLAGPERGGRGPQAVPSWHHPQAPEAAGPAPGQAIKK